MLRSLPRNISQSRFSGIATPTFVPNSCRNKTLLTDDHHDPPSGWPQRLTIKTTCNRILSLYVHSTHLNNGGSIRASCTLPPSTTALSAEIFPNGTNSEQYKTELSLQRRLKPLRQGFVAAGVVADNESMVPTGAAVILMEELQPLVNVPRNQMERVAEALSSFLQRLTEMGLRYQREFMVPGNVGWCGRTGEVKMRCNRESVAVGGEIAEERGKRVAMLCRKFADGA